MKKKILITIFILMFIIELIAPIKVNAFTEQREIVSVPAKIEHQNSLLEDMDVAIGIIMEPTVDIATTILDIIMIGVSAAMTQTGFEAIMLDEVRNVSGTASAELVISNMSSYKNVLGELDIKYPYFTYSPEEILAGKIDILSVNFISGKNSDGEDIKGNWTVIRSVVSQWYKSIRMLAIIGLLSVLIYTGIRIIMSSTAKDKAKYKELIINWFMAVVLLFSLHYLMGFILAVIETITSLLANTTGIITVYAGDATFKTNLIGLARFRLQETNLTSQITYLVLYTAFVIYTLKFTFLYFKRVFKMAFLTFISPIIALMYPIEKMNGKAQALNIWLKEFLYTALLQPVQYLLYTILITTSLALAANNGFYAVAALMFMTEAEKILKKLLGFEKASIGANQSLAGAFSAGAITSGLTNFVRNSFGGGKGSEKGNGKASETEKYELPNHFEEDITGDDNLLEMVSSTETVQDQSETPLLSINNSIYEYRQGLPTSIEELGGLHFDDGNHNSIDNILDMLHRKKGQLEGGNLSEAQMQKLDSQIFGLENVLQQRILNNESTFGGNCQYNDGDGRSTMDIMDEIRALKRDADNPNLSDKERQDKARRASELLKLVKRRMAQNQYMEREGVIPELMQNQQNAVQLPATNRGEVSKPKTPRVIKGVANVVKNAAKPIIDVDKDWKYNTKRLTGKILKGAAGVSVGITAATVQAGISITDGKYNPLEGVATVAAGVAGVSRLTGGKGELRKAYQEGANEGDNSRLMKQYAEQWYNKDDTIEFYNKEFPGRGKEMRKRAAENYVSRGITDCKEQKQALKFAELLRKERGMDIEEADKLAGATLRYKQAIGESGDFAVLYDKTKRGNYLDLKADTYSGSADKDTVRKVHEEFIQNVLDFNRANR